MPIIEVEIVEPMEAKEGLAQLLADTAGEVLKTEPGHTWVKVRFLPGDQYAENGGAPADIKPVFVSVLLGDGRNVEEKTQIASGMAVAFSGILDRPVSNIHVLFELEANGRIAFGGKLRTE